MTLLGVLRAGGAYLPLDPEQPPARTGLMLADARPAVVLTNAGLRDRLPAEPVATRAADPDAPGVAVACLEQIAAEVAARPDTPPGPAAAATWRT